VNIKKKKILVLKKQVVAHGIAGRSGNPSAIKI
jgi:hypothetical protein